MQSSRDHNDDKHESPPIINLEETDFYKILHVKSDATIEEIKKSFRKLALIYHPDKKPHGNEGVFKKINEAYCALSDSELRRTYDRSSAHDQRQFTSANKFKEKYDKYKFDLDVWTEDLVERFLETSSGNKFYTIGNPVSIKKNSNFINKLFGASLESQLRENISSDEIIRSFPTGGKILLFRNKESVSLYARTMQIGNFYSDKVCQQPAIFEVIYLDEVKNLKIELKHIRKEEEYKGCTKSTSISTTYSATDCSNVTPLIGYIELEFIGINKTYPKVNMVQSIPKITNSALFRLT